MDLRPSDLQTRGPAASSLRELWSSIEDPDFHAAEDQAHPPPKPFTIVSGSELRALAIPPRVDVLGTGVIALGQLTTVVGQGGTGKSRFIMQVAISQILGWSVAGLPTHPVPLRHLLIGTENSIYRQQGDYLRMTSPLSPEQRTRVDAGIFFHVVREVDDSFIHLGSDDIKRRWIDTLQQVQPDCIYIDPYGEVHVGDINKDADVRHTLREITKVCRRFNPRTAIVIVHHARTGRQNIAQAVGWDKGNFALGSKALYSGARSQLNLAPADPDDPSRIVVSCGKSNDARPFSPVGLRLNEQTMLYDIDPTFDLQAWKDDVEGKVRGQSASIQDVIDAVRDGSTRHKEIVEALMAATDCSRCTAIRRINEALEKGYLRKGAGGLYRISKEPRDPS